jgi:hypothetical protein
MSGQFWIGLLIGAFTGGIFGAAIMAVCAAGKNSNFWPPRGDEIIDLNQDEYHDGIAEDRPRFADRNPTYRR